MNGRKRNIERVRFPTSQQKIYRIWLHTLKGWMQRALWIPAQDSIEEVCAE